MLDAAVSWQLGERNVLLVGRIMASSRSTAFRNDSAPFVRGDTKPRMPSVYLWISSTSIRTTQTASVRAHATTSRRLTCSSVECAVRASPGP